MNAEETDTPPDAVERDEDLLTRAEASAFLARFMIRLKPASLARLWSVGGAGPPCTHIRGKPYYPRGVLRAWAESQHSGLRRSGRDARSASETRS
ncbi:hypothetical protein [Brevundimonas sp.]|uniref:hypothetical protein n=1 Tax=Brevundimonas sp. TaxID=1871086 RepID=UPI002FC5EEE1